jgi:hypothetical protein
MKDNIVYKLVGKGHRYGTNATLFMYSEKTTFGKLGKKNKDLWNTIKKFCPRYFKGSIIYAPKGSVGIMCFKTLEAAIDFKDSIWTDDAIFKIIKVRGIGKEKRKFKYFFQFIDNFLDLAPRYSSIKKQKDLINSPENWVTYPAVEVLE